MVVGVTTEGESVHPRMRRRLKELGRRFATINPNVAFVIAAFLAGAAVLLMYDPLRQMEVGDEAGYDYIAQCILLARTLTLGSC